MNSIADLRENIKEINKNYEEQIVEYLNVGQPQEALLRVLIIIFLFNDNIIIGVCYILLTYVLPQADILIQMESTNKAIDLIHCFCERLVMRLLNHRYIPNYSFLLIMVEFCCNYGIEQQIAIGFVTSFTSAYWLLNIMVQNRDILAAPSTCILLIIIPNDSSGSKVFLKAI